MAASARAWSRPPAAPGLVVVALGRVSRVGTGWSTFGRVGEIVDGLVEAGWEPTFVAREAAAEFTTHALPESVEVLPIGVPWSSLSSLGRWFRLVGVLRRARCAVVLMPSLLAAFCAVVLGKRAVVFFGGSWHLWGVGSFLRRKLEELVAKRAFCLLVAGEDLRVRFGPYAREVELSVPYVHEEVVSRIRNGEQAFAPCPVRVLFVGWIKAEKGVREVLAAARALPEVEFRLVGARAEEAVAAEVDAATEQLGNLTMRGFRGWSELRSDYLWANTLTLPSVVESFPRVIPEAVAFGLAPVVTPVGGIPAVLVDGEDALFVNVGDSQSLIGALHRLVEDPTLGERIARSACSKLRPWFAAEDGAGQFDRHLHEILRQRAHTHSRSRPGHGGAR